MGRRPNDKPPRAKYVRPAVRSYQVYEQNSLGCGKTNPGTLACRRNPKAS